MRSREEYINLIQDKRKNMSLKTRLCLMVTAEMIICSALGVGVDVLFKYLFGDDWGVPIIVEFLAFSILLGLLVTRLLSKIFFDPIKKVRGAMRKVADGDFTVQLNDETSSREINEIYAGFNFMTRELASTEILQSDFVSSVSHEFKTPLNAIEGYSTLLQDCDNLDENQKNYVDKIIYNTKRLSSLAGNVLLLSKLENQSIPINQKFFDLSEQIRQCILSLEPLWDSKQIEFDVDMEDINYYGNEELTIHIWNNLIGNAIKFTPEASLVKISLKKLQNEIEFKVEDSGAGISKEAERHIFDKFYQADSSHKSEGNGLGLAMVKRIVDLENGKITVQNSQNGGAIFKVILKSK
jgi:signal transduction histidine kinase